MPTYEKCPKAINELADELLTKYAQHKPLLEQKVKIDFLFAYPTKNEAGEPKGDAISHHGHKALGLTRKTNLKERTAGRADAEILLDGEWWAKASEKCQRALLDHELHHLSIAEDSEGVPKRDDAGRPCLKLRKHDVEVGWFTAIAERHGIHSMERIQAQMIFDDHGQSFWPVLVAQSTVDKMTPKKPNGIQAQAS